MCIMTVYKRISTYFIKPPYLNCQMKCVRFSDSILWQNLCCESWSKLIDWDNIYLHD